MHRNLHTPDIPPPPPTPFDLYWNEFHLLRRKVNARHILVSNAIAGLHVTWRRPCRRSRTKPFLFFGNKNLFSCKFFAKKILLFWAPTWLPCHEVANQELLVSNFFFYFGQKPPSAIWVLVLKLLAKMYKPRAYKSYFTVNCMLWRQQTCEHTLKGSLPRHERFQNSSRSKRGVGQTYP